MFKHHRMVGDRLRQRVVGGKSLNMAGGRTEPFALVLAAALHHDTCSQGARSGSHTFNEFAETAGAGEIY